MNGPLSVPPSTTRRDRFPRWLPWALWGAVIVVGVRAARFGFGDDTARSPVIIATIVVLAGWSRRLVARAVAAGAESADAAK